MQRPEKNEFAAFYEGYVSLVPEIEILSVLENQISDIEKILAEIPAEKTDFAYAEGKWTIKQLFGHIIDAERVFAYRALRFSRGDRTPLASFDENFYVEQANFQQQTIADLGNEFCLLRKADLLMFKSLADDNWLQIGIANECEMSVRATAYVMVGHVRHHLKILNERYLT